MEVNGPQPVPVWIVLILISFIVGMAGLIFRRLRKEMDTREQAGGTAIAALEAFIAKDAERVLHWTNWRNDVNKELDEHRRMLDAISTRQTRARERMSNIETVIRMRKQYRDAELDDHDDRD